MRSEEHQAYSFEDERKRIKACFCAFVEGSLVSHDIDAVLQLFCDDVIGIGMGAQGIVRCREDLRPILMNTRSDVDDSQTAIDYSNMQVRYYGDDYASINAMVSVTTTVRGERRTSHIGQCASLRRIDGQWRINMVQATPLSIDIQDIDSYPLSFAEDEIGNYRRQAQFSSIMRRSIIATYKIDFESDSFEEYVAASGSSVAVQQGDPYERIMQESAMVLVDDAMKLEFISTFSIANLKKCYRAGQTDVTLDYESPQPDGRVVWLRNSLHLFTDIKGRLKGYLYLFDIDAYKRQALRLAHQAEHDSSTGVFNKGTTRQKIEMALNLYAMPKTCAFFMIDLDHFKQINDSYGHAVGDEVIRQTAEILTSSFRAEDVVGRLGGDEFCVFYTGQNDVGTLGCKAAQICEAVRHIHPAQNGGPGTSVSIGIARRESGDDFDNLYRKADAALYQRKEALGRDGYTIYSDGADS